MQDDALWYEAAFVVGMTNALNVVADSLAPQPGVTLLTPVEEASAEPKTAAVFADDSRLLCQPRYPPAFSTHGA